MGGLRAGGIPKGMALHDCNNFGGRLMLPAVYYCLVVQFQFWYMVEPRRHKTLLTSLQKLKMKTVQFMHRENNCNPLQLLQIESGLPAPNAHVHTGIFCFTDLTSKMKKRVTVQAQLIFVVNRLHPQFLPSSLSLLL